MLEGQRGFGEVVELRGFKGVSPSETNCETQFHT